MDEFYIQGIYLKPEAVPSGWTEPSLVEIQGLPGGPVQVDRFDCRLLLDSADLASWLSRTTKGYDVEDTEKDLDDIRYGDLYSENEEEEEAVDRHGNEFQYTYGREIWVPPPPPLPPLILRQIVEPCDESQAVCGGPCSLRELSVIHAVATNVAKQSGGSLEKEIKLCNEMKENPGVEFLQESHVHHCIFVDMLSQARQITHGETDEPKVVSSLHALREYADDDFKSNSDMIVPVMTKILCGMLDKLHNKAGEQSIIIKIEQGNTWLNSATYSEFDNLVKVLKERAASIVTKVTPGESGDGLDDGSGYPFGGDGVTNVDKSTRALRLLKAQMMMKKRRVEHDEKSKVIRAQAVQQDTHMRQTQIAQIAHHRKMFQDSDDDD